MKNSSSITLTSIKTNKNIVQQLKTSKRINLPYITLWIGKGFERNKIQYALLLSKTQFKLAVIRNKIKRQLRNILIKSNWSGGMSILFKPNQLWLKKTYLELESAIIKIVNTYHNGK